MNPNSFSWPTGLLQVPFETTILFSHKTPGTSPSQRPEWTQLHIAFRSGCFLFHLPQILCPDPLCVWFLPITQISFSEDLPQVPCLKPSTHIPHCVISSIAPVSFLHRTYNKYSPIPLFIHSFKKVYAQSLSHARPTPPPGVRGIQWS